MSRLTGKKTNSGEPIPRIRASSPKDSRRTNAGTYTFTATYTDQHTEAFTYDFQPGTPGALPADVNVNAAGILSWGPNTAVDHYYYIVYDSDGVVIRNAEGTQYPDGVTINLYSMMGAYRDETGTYFAQVVAVYGGGVTKPIRKRWHFPTIRETTPGAT